MLSKVYSYCFIVLLFGTINTLPPYRYRRQSNLPQNDGSIYNQRLARAPSGSIKGTYYYGIGSDPNYGSHIARPNTVHGGDIASISYDPNSALYGNLVQASHRHQQQQQQQQRPYYWYNRNNNNAWQRQNMNNNEYYNRYAPGTQGWYATGGNYWFNNGQSIIVHPCLMIITFAFLILCK